MKTSFRLNSTDLQLDVEPRKPLLPILRSGRLCSTHLKHTHFNSGVNMDWQEWSNLADNESLWKNHEEKGLLKAEYAGDYKLRLWFEDELDETWS